MQCIICGRGGQGVITLNSMLGNLASSLGHSVISAETHGMAMRGGSVYTSIKIGKSSCPTIGEGEADLILSMDSDEVFRNIHFLTQNGIIITDGVIKEDIPFKVINVPAKKAALEQFGKSVHLSTILFGAAIKLFPEIFNHKKSKEILKANKKLNYDAFIYGLEGEY